ncbi:MAG: hypothetical protein MHMPM18_003068 [Marteilia pararefringens]
MFPGDNQKRQDEGNKQHLWAIDESNRPFEFIEPPVGSRLQSASDFFREQQEFRSQESPLKMYGENFSDIALIRPTEENPAPYLRLYTSYDPFDPSLFTGCCVKDGENCSYHINRN